jgi:uncharacterized protein YndB with AHSA1/START domain
MATSTAAAAAQGIDQLAIIKDEQISAPIEIVFETILEQLGPGMQTMDGKSLHMKLEAWPGGRWFRDLGNNNGHLWGHVQAIRSPDLLEIYGPLMMSGATVSGVQYRLFAEGGKTRVHLEHRAMGVFPPAAVDGMGKGWGASLGQIRDAAERKAKGAK